MRAAAGLIRVDPRVGRQVVDRLVAADSPPALRLRAALVAVRMWDEVTPLARIAFDVHTPLDQRATAVSVLADVAQGLEAPDLAGLWFLPSGVQPAGRPWARPHRFPESLRRRLAALATADATPAQIRVAAASLLPEERRRATLGAIAEGAGGAPLKTRVAAIALLDRIDGRAAEVAFGRLLRDRRVFRLRRWWLVVADDGLLSQADEATLEDRLGDAESWRLALRQFRLAMLAPERVLGPVANPVEHPPPGAFME
jgi:hypothetical protein